MLLLPILGSFLVGTLATFGDLKQQLTDLEWSALIGRQETGELYDVVYPEVEERHRRSADSPRRLVLEAPNLSRNFTLYLTPTGDLLDPKFVLLNRWENKTDTLPLELVERDCYFQSLGENQAAISLCGGVRGVIKPLGAEYYVINPLPKRFTKRSSDSPPHVIVKKHISHFHGHPPEQVLTSFCGVRSETIGPRYEPGNRYRRSVRTPVHVETAVFVDSDMFRLMSNNFPVETEREVVRFVLAMVNAVQLLYHDPSLGQPVTFVMKRLEILHTDPAGLVRFHDIDRFLGNFCAWQREENPSGDDDPLHWDHAVILTGLDLFVRSKNGKFSSQVVGLAPVAGMCTPTSSCTVNEGRHFESVYVVAHEIGHNLGMRHDGPLADNNCDPTSYLMSPTLGSGKITWSECSRHYLQLFLRSPQSHCLMDHLNSESQLDHTSAGQLPGERFNADQQCMLKYGAGSRHATSQPLHDLCRDLHCHRDRYTWTSHPALEGTACGNEKWCRSGRCVVRGLSSQLTAGSVAGVWGPWGPFSECASGCLQAEGGGLGAGSTGIMFAHRQCNSPRPENGGGGCLGGDRKYRTCSTNQCENIPKTTVRDFADEVCIRAREVDSDLVGTGLQKVSPDKEGACAVWCYKRNGGSKSRGWTFPDGTACRTHQSKQAMFCISGLCQEFTCERDNSKESGSHFLLSSDMCQVSRGKRREVAVGVWQPTSDCYYNCVTPGSGIRLAEKRFCLQCNSSASIQLCKPDNRLCGKIVSTLEYASTVCTKYRERVRRLSGMGMQLSPAPEDPDRSCRIACQDEAVLHRFYLVNGEDGWFPFGTDCSKGDTTKKAFCIRGKCLEFGSDDTPLHESEYILPSASRHRRSFDHSVTVRTTLDNQTLAEMVQYLNQTGGHATTPSTSSCDVLDLDNPVIADFTDWFKFNAVDSSYSP